MIEADHRDADNHQRKARHDRQQHADEAEEDEQEPDGGTERASVSWHEHLSRVVSQEVSVSQADRTVRGKDDRADGPATPEGGPTPLSRSLYRPTRALATRERAQGHGLTVNAMRALSPGAGDTGAVVEGKQAPDELGEPGGLGGTIGLLVVSARAEEMK